MGAGSQHLGGELLQGRDVIQHPYATAVCAQYQVVFPGMDGDIIHRDHGQVSPEHRPGCSSVDRKIGPSLCSHEQEIRICVMLSNDIHDASNGKIG